MARLPKHAFPVLFGASVISGLAPLDAAAQSSADPLATAAELVSACQSARQGAADEKASLCTGYLLGYLQANPLVVFSEDLPSTFMQRVMRTRAPDHASTQSVKSAKFCLEDENSVAELRDHVASFNIETAANIMPAAVIDQILQQQYPCEQ